MRPIRLAVLFTALNLVAPGAPLGVLRVSPKDDADPRTQITVTFDRPVAGGLDVTVEAGRILRIEPAVAGRAEWRDPVTLRFIPTAPLVAGASYRVTISNDFVSMDGSRLDRPYSFSFKIKPPEITWGNPIHPPSRYVNNAPDTVRFITARPTLQLTLSAPADPQLVAALSSIELSHRCGGQRVGLNLVRVWAPRGDTIRNLTRTVELIPKSDLPLNCAANLMVPRRVERTATDRMAWPFQTYGPLTVKTEPCAGNTLCPTGPIKLTFGTPVRGTDVLRRVRIAPALTYSLRDSTVESTDWILNVRLEPRQHYAVVIDSLLTDRFGQRLGKLAVHPFVTTSYGPTVAYPFGRLLIERNGLRTLPVQLINVDTLLVTSVAVPDSAEAWFLAQAWGWNEPLQTLLGRATVQKIPLQPSLDKPFIAGVPFAPGDARVTSNGTLRAVYVARPGSRYQQQLQREERPGIALVQVSDLAVHGRVGIDEGMVWVTGVGDGRPRAHALVTLYDRAGKVRTTAHTDAQGLARLSNFRPSASESDCEFYCGGFDGYAAAVLNDDRAVVGFNAYDPDLAPWRFDIWGAWSDAQRTPAAMAVFTERGIYRPGERVYAKAIVRQGTLGALTVPRGDSLKWVFTDRENGTLRDTITTLSSFGTADVSLVLSPDLPLGEYQVQLNLKRNGAWQAMATTRYQVAEYRPPEFLVDVSADRQPRMTGDSLSANISARYLFGAPMAGAQVRWTVQQRGLSPWELEIPNTDGWWLGGYDDDDYSRRGGRVQVAQEGVDSLDARGSLDVKLALPAPADGQGAYTGITAVVTDANRQTVSAGTSVLVHPAAFYIGARVQTTDYFWRAGTPLALEVMAVQPSGQRVSGATVQAAVIRLEWHRVRRTRHGQLAEVGGWVSDTVTTCSLQTATQPVSCSFTPARGGRYKIALTARDAEGRLARTTLWNWAEGPDWVPWRDETRLRIDIIPDRERYSVGDTATVLITSPFTNVEAWLTIERERVLESRRMRITAGATTVKVPITEALAPNAFVSVLLVRGRSAAPGPLDDPGRPALRVGYAELRVLPAVKQLNLEVAPLQEEYRPGDTARVRVAVTDALGRGQRAEVTLWGVDEGVLALTGYQTPDPLSLIYQPRPLGVRLASNLASVAPQVPPGQKGQRESGGGGGGDISGIMRSRFQTTAFFIGSLVTDANGNAVASAKLPDNLTTFRVMAVAVTAGDRYGSGKSSLLVTRPLLARPSLPRFVREGDRFAAGVVVNQRAGGTRRVDVEATARGIALRGPNRKNETLNGAAGREVRFDFTAQPGDSARFQFSVRGGGDADAVAVRVPVKPSFHPLAQTIAGALRDTTTAEFVLEQEIDAARSRLEINFGSSTLSVFRGARNGLRVYPYYCTEQVSSMALPIIALYRAQRELGAAGLNGNNAEADIRTAIRTITRRQRPDGGFGLWGPYDWTSPWLTAYATRVLLEARAAGFAVDSTMLNRVHEYLARSLQESERPRFVTARWYDHPGMSQSERVAAVDLLSRIGRADVAMENTLLGQAAQLRWEDRVQLAEVVARRGALAPARSLLATAWRGVRSEGRSLVLPAGATDHYFRSNVRPAARLLAATLAIQPDHPQIGLLVETLVQQERATEGRWIWNTQDYGSLVMALLSYESRRRELEQPVVQVRVGGRTLLTRDLRTGEPRDTSIALTGLVNGQRVRVRLSALNATTPVFYNLTVREVPRARPVNPVDHGIAVERWYERTDTRRPTVSIAAGELVRVRIRITVPAERHFVVVDDPLPAGLEAVDLSLRTVAPFGAAFAQVRDAEPEQQSDQYDWYFGSWDSGVWSAFDHKELRDDRVVYVATVLLPGTYTATYLARATTAGTFIMPPAHAEEMYNPAVNGRTGGGVFTVTSGVR
ncbi:MAG: alpha-2-macroglobulin family protein [Longimicrobiales bacterium]